METRLINIGNSKGIRIPKNVIEKYHFGETLDVIETDEGILVKAIDAPRKGWEDQFKNAQLAGNEELSDFNEVSNGFDREEWTW